MILLIFCTPQQSASREIRVSETDCLPPNNNRKSMYTVECKPTIIT